MKHRRKSIKRISSLLLAFALVGGWCFLKNIAMAATGTGTLTINEVYQDENGIEERTDTSTETYTYIYPDPNPDGSARIWRPVQVFLNAPTPPEGYSVVSYTDGYVANGQPKTLTYIYKKNPAPITDKYNVTASPLKLGWQGLSGDPVTKQVGNVTVTCASKNVGRFAGATLITVDPSELPDGRSITISVPNKNINLTIGGVTVAATVDFDDVTLDNTSGSRQLMVTATTDRDDLSYNDFFGKAVVGSIALQIDEN